ncbi:VOC family protein [Flavobacterium salmonis]|uniref:VOC family protein n=1 Tax=Flavobacterium salmonis TaxID=2654844 RepID=A0A6V6YVD4_9FLAO|nr:VOC family protein [Flavobacterium salmonis]CAD0002642.1 VOC family protein [Flavobacterium salmonis]
MVKSVTTYLMFNGNCEEAFLFYKSVFGGEFQYVGKYKDAPEEEGAEALSEEDSNRIMHISLPIGDTILMGSDSHPKYGDVGFGDNFSISIGTETTEEADKIFSGLSAGGRVDMPLEKTFWSSYFGMLKDKFGVNWMISLEEPQPGN